VIFSFIAGGVMVHTFLKRTLLLPLIGMVLLMPSCKKPAYSPKSLQQICLTNTSLQTKDNVIVHCKLLSKQETHMLFDGRGSRLLHKRKPIYALYLYIENKTHKTFVLGPSCISFKLINPELVAQRLYSHTTRRIVIPLIIGVVGAGATFLAAAYVTLVGVVGSLPVLIKSGYAGLGISALFAGGTPFVCYNQGNQAIATNALIYHDVMNKSLHKNLFIEPGASVSTLLFVPHRCYNSSFNMRLIDATSEQSLPYDIIIEEGEWPCKK
jgi:hypothetical protein